MLKEYFGIFVSCVGGIFWDICVLCWWNIFGYLCLVLVEGWLDYCRMVDMRQEVAALAEPGHQELQHLGKGQNL